MIYCYQILCFSMSNYLNACKQFVFILTVALWNVFPPQKLCVVYLNCTGYQMKAEHIDLINILINENLTFLANKGDLLLKCKYFVIIS